MSSNFDGAAVEIIEENPLTPTGGHFLADNMEFTLSSQTPGTVTETPFSWPFPIAALEMQIDVSPELVGDIITLEVGPDTVVGTLTAAAADTDTVFTVAQSVVDNTVIGELAEIDGQALGYVLGVDADALTITTQTGASGTIASGALVKKTRLMGRNVRLQAANVSKVIGRSKIGGSYLPAGTVFNVVYTNTDGAAKTVSFLLECLY